MINGRRILFKELGVKAKVRRKNNICKKQYVLLIFTLSTIFSFFTGAYLILISNKILESIILALLLYIPVSEIIIQMINYILSKIVKPKIIPKLDFSKNIPKEYSTFVVIPTIIDSKEKVIELIKKLEVYFLANKSENLYFALLGDCTSSKASVEENDKYIIQTGIDETKKLNKKYKNQIDSFPIFHFLYRKRTWSNEENCYLGWERKRGLLCQFNEYLVDGNNNFLVNTINDFR